MITPCPSLRSEGRQRGRADTVAMKTCSLLLRVTVTLTDAFSFFIPVTILSSVFWKALPLDVLLQHLFLCGRPLIVESLEGEKDRLNNQRYFHKSQFFFFSKGLYLSK